MRQLVDRKPIVNKTRPRFNEDRRSQCDPDMRRAVLPNRSKRSFDRIQNAAVALVVVATTLVGAGAAMADKGDTKRIVVASTGNGSYVCSPAGFGQKSRCSSR